MLISNYTCDFLEKLEENQSYRLTFYMNQHDIQVLYTTVLDDYVADYDIDTNDKDSVNDAIQTIFNTNYAETLVADIEFLNLEVDGLTDEYIAITDILNNADVCNVNNELITEYELTQFEYEFLKNIKIRQDKERLNDSSVTYYINKIIDYTITLYTENSDGDNSIFMTYDMCDIENLRFDTLDYECVAIDDILSNCTICNE